MKQTGVIALEKGGDDLLPVPGVQVGPVRVAGHAHLLPQVRDRYPGVPAEPVSESPMKKLCTTPSRMVT